MTASRNSFKVHVFYKAPVTSSIRMGNNEQGAMLRSLGRAWNKWNRLGTWVRPGSTDSKDHQVSFYIHSQLFGRKQPQSFYWRAWMLDMPAFPSTVREHKDLVTTTPPSSSPLPFLSPPICSSPPFASFHNHSFIYRNTIAVLYQRADAGGLLIWGLLKLKKNTHNWC